VRMDIKTVDTILTAFDLETASDATLTRAIQLARTHDARLVLLHVIEAEPMLQAASLSGRSESDLRSQLKRGVLARIEPLLIACGRTRRTDMQVEFGSPHDVIKRMAKKQHADVIVVGPSKKRSLKERILGVTADRVIRTAHTSVLIVKKRSEEPYRQVAAAVDFSPQSATAIEEACKLVPEATLQLVHAIDIPLTFHQAMLRAGTPQIEIQRYRSAIVNKAREDLFGVWAHSRRDRQSGHTCRQKRTGSRLGPPFESPQRRTVGNGAPWSRRRSPSPSRQRDAPGAQRSRLRCTDCHQVTEDAAGADYEGGLPNVIQENSCSASRH
jgi:nucleotide-binding universal stress UspA family protein